MRVDILSGYWREMISMVRRTPIHGNGFTKFMILATEEDLRTLNMILVYEAVRKKRTGVRVYKVIPQGIDPKTHTRWKQFEKARILCDENGFSYEEFILAQFIQMLDWSKCPIPMPNHLYNDSAVDRFHKYLAEWKRTRKRLGIKKKHRKGTAEYYDSLVDDYVQRTKKIGGHADRLEFITIGVVTGIFPVWYATKRVPDWKRRAKKLGVES
jgi:hypothetical protein